MPTIQIGVVGIGKIARDQHLPALAASTEFTLAAVATHHGEVEGMRTHRDTASLLQTHPEIEAVSFCQLLYTAGRASRAGAAGHRSGSSCHAGETPGGHCR
jgi:hypothetical protein